MFGKKSTKGLVRPSPETGSSAPQPKEAATNRAKHEPKTSAEKRYRPPVRDILKSKLFLGALSLFVAAALAFGVVPYLQTQMNQTAPAVVLRQDLPAGTLLLSEMLETKSLPRTQVAADALQLSEAAGRYLTVDTLQGDILTNRRVSAHIPGEHPELTALPEGRLAISAAMTDLAQSVSGKLRAGDVIQVFAVFGDTADETDYHAVIVPELRFVEVLAVTNSDLYDITSGDEVEDRRVATVVLSVNEQQAAVLAGLNASAKLHMALVTRGDSAAKESALARQETVFTEVQENPADSIRGEEAAE